MTTTQDDLKSQFQAIEENQKRKFIKIKQQNARIKQRNEGGGEAFGVNDDLGLMGTIGMDQEKVEFETAKDEYENKIRSMEDENGRLLHLIKEKEVEAKLLRKKWEKDKILLETMSTGSTSDAASTKIVDLSKKLRELTAELESERNKNRLSARRIQELANQVQNKSFQKPRELVDEERLQMEVKSTQEKLKQSELKMAEYRNQTSSLKQELKLTQKALSNELGDNVNVQTVLKSDSTWRGRSQQILTLQQKVNELKSQLEGSELEFGNGSALSGRRTASLDHQHKEQIRKLERERKENLHKLEDVVDTLEKERDDLKGKLDASKARNKVLSNEIKSLKNQTQTLLVKTDHDNELIQALMKQIDQLQKGLVSATKNKSDSNEKFNKNMTDMKLQSEQYLNRIKHLQNTIHERDSHLIQLEDEIENMKKKTSQSHAQSNNRVSKLSNCRIENNIGVVSIDQEELGSSRRTSSRISSRSSSRLGDTPRSDVEHYKILSQTAQVERDKLVELIGIMQKRVQDAEENRIQSEQALKSERKQTAILEKQIGKLKSEGRRLEESETDILLTKIDNLEKEILLKTDEIDMLKMALDRSTSAKEEDLKIFQQVIEQTKNMFLKAAKHK